MTGVLVQAAIIEAVPNLRPLIEDLASDIDAAVPVGTASELLGWEKDATGTLLQIAGHDRGILRSWRPVPGRVSFLAGLSATRVHENTLIEHDADRFLPDWLPIQVADVGWRAFAKPNSRDRILIYNGNDTAVEDTLGVDLIYFNESYRCFVLVQYKKMERQPADNEWSYRPDNRLRSQLERMRRLDESSEPGDGSDYRLFDKPSWLKLCRAESIKVDSSDLIGGMYLPREVVEQLLASPSIQGPRGGPIFDYNNVRRYLNPTTFIALVADGWIGSKGTTTEAIAQQIADALADNDAVVVGVHTTERPPGNMRRRRY